MSIQIERTGNPVFPWRVSKVCESDAEFLSTIKALEAAPPPQAFHPPEPSPATAALIERAEAADDTHVGDLKAWEAVNG